MPRIGDVVLVGPRLAIAMSSRAVRWSAEFAVGSYRLATGLLGNGSRLEGGTPPTESPKPDAKPYAAPRKQMAKDEDEGVASNPTSPSDDEPAIPDVVPNVPQAVGGGFPEPPGSNPGDLSEDPTPHHALATPVGDPDQTEWPDPYEQREDPRDPPDPDAEPFGEEPRPQVGAQSTSEPHPDTDIEAPDANPPQRDKLDD
jgi:hypothetical protein